MNKLVLGFVAAMVMLCVSGSVWAFESTSIDVSLDFNSKYIWRGQLINDDYAFQPGISVALDNLTLGIWGSMNMTDYGNNRDEFTEYDYYADYTTSIAEGIDLSVGVIDYYFPSLDNGFGQTTEIYCGFAFDLPLSPSVTAYFDVDEAKGTYVSFGVGHSIEKVAELNSETPIGMEIGASLGWGSESYNKYYWGAPANDSALNDLSVSVAFPFELGNWTVSPSVSYVTLLDSDVKKTDTYATGSHTQDSDYYFTGLSLSTSF